MKPTEKWNLEGLKSVSSKRCASKILRGSVRSDLEKLDSFTLETSKNHLIDNFMRNGRLMVKILHTLTGGLYEDHLVLICHSLTFYWIFEQEWCWKSGIFINCLIISFNYWWKWKMNAISNGLIIGNTARVRIEQDEDARLPKNIDYTIQVLNS